MNIPKLGSVLFWKVYPPLFALGERFGVHITPNHYYWPIPDIKSLDESLWSARSEMVGIDLRESAQVQLLDDFVARSKAEFDQVPVRAMGTAHQYYSENPMFLGADAAILYHLIRTRRPKKIIEIGSGFSTYVSAQALLKNQAEDGDSGELIAIEPYPNATLRAGFPGLTRLMQTPLQKVPLSTFETLAENDILFIDSSHVLKIGSDVQYEYLEVLPRLKRGVLVHIHDIFLPYEYPKEWVYKLARYWTEQYLLQAFLAFNDHFEVVWAAHFMRKTYPEKLRDALRPHSIEGAASFWIRKTK
jgi:predicted O-methyltransferase YrrM